MQNIPGKRVLLKSDGGPGRTHQRYLEQSHIDGLVHYPTLPNGTLFQELDQVFGFLKTLMENNRKRIWQYRFEQDGANAKVKISDLAFILFGGKYYTTSGDYFTLDNAFAEGLDKEHLDSAIAKCGYVPANRIALESGKLRHELVRHIDGTLNEELNNMGMAETLLELERQNHKYVAEAVRKGYKLAVQLERKINTRKERISSEINNSVTLTQQTLAEHRRKLGRAKTQGAHFRVTQGGAPMNNSEALCAAELLAWEKEHTLLQKKKKQAQRLRKEIKELSKVQLNNNPASWKKDEIISKIRQKDPTIKRGQFSTLKKEDLLKLYHDDFKHLPNIEIVPHIRFTKKDERLLVKLKEGNIEDYEKTGIYQRAVKERFEFLARRAENIPKNESISLAMILLKKNFDSLESASTSLHEHFNNDYSSFPDTIQPCPTVDALSDDEESYYSEDEEIEQADLREHHNTNDFNDVDAGENNTDTVDEDERIEVYLQEYRDMNNVSIDDDYAVVDQDEIEVDHQEDLSVDGDKEEDSAVNEDEIEVDCQENVRSVEDVSVDGKEEDDAVDQDEIEVDRQEGVSVEDVHCVDGVEVDNEKEVSPATSRTESTDEDQSVSVDGKKEDNAVDQDEIEVDHQEGVSVEDAHCVDGVAVDNEKEVSPAEDAHCVDGVAVDNEKEVSPATSRTESTDEDQSSSLTAEYIDELVRNKMRTKLKELYEQFYGEPHPKNKVHSKTLAQAIKEKL